MIVTAQAAQVWEFLFDEPLPARVTVRLEKYHDDSIGMTRFWRGSVEVVIDTRMRFPLPTLIHEFIHVRHPKWPHSADFYREEDRLCAKLGIDNVTESSKRHDLRRERLLAREAPLRPGQIAALREYEQMGLRLRWVP